jgi:hypothetical protein
MVEIYAKKKIQTYTCVTSAHIIADCHGPLLALSPLPDFLAFDLYIDVSLSFYMACCPNTRHGLIPYSIPDLIPYLRSYL